MIVLADESTVAELKRLSLGKNIHACRIACLLDSYGLSYDFCRFWLQLDEGGRAVSAVSKYYSDVTAALTEESSIAELREFIDVIGADSISSDKPLADMGDNVTMRLEALKKPVSIAVGSFDCEPDLKEVYRLLGSCREELAVPGYEDFMLDMSHKLRHNTAMCVSLREKDRLVSCAMTVSQSQTCAVIGAVATEKSQRGRGFGSACVYELCKRLSDREILLLRERDKNKGFYESLGFIDTE